MEKHAPFVKEQVAFQERMARRYANEQWRHDLHMSNVYKLQELMNDIENLKNENERMKAAVVHTTPSLRSMTLTPDDLEGLPDEVIQELSISDSDKQEFAIVGLINEAGGILSLDKIIVGIFRKTGEAVKRAPLTSRLYRMAQKGLIFNVPMRKGFYATRQMNEADVRRIFGLEDGEEGDKDPAVNA